MDEPAPLPEAPPALLAFARGETSKEAAIDALGLRDYAQLLMLVGARGLSPPRLPEEVAGPMRDDFVRLAREARAERALHPDHS